MADIALGEGVGPLLTVFRKSRRHEQFEIDRAAIAMGRCRGAGHVPEANE